MAKLSEFKNYVGDVNLEYGGLFINLDDFKHGYANCLRVIDLDSAAGIDYTVMVERLTVYFDNGKKVKQALGYCGVDELPKEVKWRKLWIVEACASYGLCDTVSDMSGGHRWLFVHREDVDDQDLDNWHAEVVILDDDVDIFDYLYDNGFLSEFE